MWRRIQGPERAHSCTHAAPPPPTLLPHACILHACLSTAIDTPASMSFSSSGPAAASASSDDDFHLTHVLRAHTSDVSTSPTLPPHCILAHPATLLWGNRRCAVWRRRSIRSLVARRCCLGRATKPPCCGRASNPPTQPSTKTQASTATDSAARSSSSHPAPPLAFHAVKS